VNAREYAVLEALNIASTIHGRWDKVARERIYQASAVEIADVLVADERIAADFTFVLDARSVGALLGAMAGSYPQRRAPLVERVTTRRWGLTDAGIEVLTA
jgi:hypothetical protein